MESNKSFRVRTTPTPGDNTKLNIKLDSDYDIIEILSLKLTQENFYKSHSSNYGVIIGRAIANGGLGVPNAKISVFIPVTEETRQDVYKNIIYPYSSVTDKNGRQIRYNLLPDAQLSECYAKIGTFPEKRMMLDNNAILEVFDEYYKYTTVTNTAGDYMLFGVPTGNNQIHCDVDLSDCGYLSQYPRDMYSKGYNEKSFENSRQFKKDVNLDDLVQTRTENSGVYVYPLWGDDTEHEIAITRYDINIQYKFEGTCVFIGGSYTDKIGNIIRPSCKPSKITGKLSEMQPSLGKIEILRKTQTGGIEQISIEGDNLIDGDGVWNFQLPLNMDWLVIDEYGNQQISDNPNIGIATRGEFRFRFSLTLSETQNQRTAYFLVPNNPASYELEKDTMYFFNHDTPDHFFVTMFRDTVYSVKQYIPRLQLTFNFREKLHTGIKDIRLSDSNLNHPFNRIDMSLSIIFSILCGIATFLITLVAIVNKFLSALSHPFPDFPWPIRSLSDLLNKVFCDLIVDKTGGCIELGQGWCEFRETHFYPGCDGKCLVNKAKQNHRDENGNEEPISTNGDELRDCVIASLGDANDIGKFQFFNDWVNGSLYFPLFYYQKYKKRRRKFLGIFGSRKEYSYEDFCGIVDEDKKKLMQSRRVFRGINKVKIVDSLSQRYAIEGNNGRFVGKGNINGYCQNSNEHHVDKEIDGLACYKQTSWFHLREGIVNKVTVANTNSLMEPADEFYYRPLAAMEIDQNEIKKPTLLYATDIICLGSLNECNENGFYQLHKFLPPTTYQGQDYLFDADYALESEDPIRYKYIGEEAVYDMSTTSGISWGKLEDGRNKNGMGFLETTKGIFRDPSSTGLMFGLECFDSSTTTKSLVNAERLSELGVSLDFTYTTYQCNEDGTDHNIFYDGLVTKKELINTIDVRQMFATLNSGRLTSKIFNPETEEEEDNLEKYHGKKYYKIKYKYPINFDGRMFIWSSYVDKDATASDKYSNLVTEKEPDMDYVEYRTGKKVIDSNLFYKVNYEKEKWGSFIRYENSFYFYFGLKSGKTAIDKFRQKFYTNCRIESEDNVSGSVEIINGAMVCSCTGNITVVPKFRLSITDAEGEYTVSFYKEDNTPIKITPGDVITSTKKFLVISSKKESGIDGYSQDFIEGGNFIYEIVNGVNTFTGNFTIPISGLVGFSMEQKTDIVGQLGPDYCPGGGGCEGLTECICCEDILSEPKEDDMNILKARVEINNINNVIQKGCTLCDYKLIIESYRYQGKNLQIKITGVTGNGGISSFDILNRGEDYIISGPKDAHVIEGGKETATFNITEIYANGSVKEMNIVDAGEGYSVDKVIDLNRVKYVVLSKEYTCDSDAKWAAYAAGYDGTPYYIIPLYLCAGNYDVKLENTSGPCEGKNDFGIQTIEIIEHEPIELQFIGEENCTVWLKRFNKVDGLYPKDDEWWDKFYKYLVDDKNKYLIKELEKWYSWVDEIDTSTKDKQYASVAKFKDCLYQKFIMDCQGPSISLNGYGYKGPYRYVLMGERKVPGMTISSQDGSKSFPQPPVANDSLSRIYVEVEDKYYDVPYCTRNSVYDGDIEVLDTIKYLDVNGECSPDALVPSVAKIPIKNGPGKYLHGGYYTGVMGDGGKGQAYPTQLGAVCATIRKQKNNPDYLVTPKDIHDYLVNRPGGYLPNVKKTLFHFHVFDRRALWFHEWARISAVHKDFVVPYECEIKNLKGVANLYYRNGNGDLKDIVKDGDSELNIENGEEYYIDNKLHLETCPLGLPTIRNVVVYAEKEEVAEVSLVVQEAINDGYKRLCTSDILLDFSLKLENTPTKVQSHVECNPDGTMRQVTNYYCYGLIISKNNTTLNLQEIYQKIAEGDVAGAVNLLGGGDYDIFHARYKKTFPTFMPEEILYFNDKSLEDWTNRLSYPWYTSDPELWGDLYDPGKNDAGCSEDFIPTTGTWITSDYPKGHIIDEVPETTAKHVFTTSNFVDRTCKVIRSDLGTKKMPDDVRFAIVHDNETLSRAFSQPRDYGNYIEVEEPDYVPTPNTNDGTYTVTIKTKLMGNNAFKCQGYKWVIQEGNYEYLLNPSNDPGPGWEIYNTDRRSSGKIIAAVLTDPGLRYPDTTPEDCIIIRIFGDGSGARVKPIYHYGEHLCYLDKIELEASGYGYTWAAAVVYSAAELSTTLAGLGWSKSLQCNLLSIQFDDVREEIIKTGKCVERRAAVSLFLDYNTQGDEQWIKLEVEKTYEFDDVKTTNGGIPILEAPLLELDCKNREKILRISAIDKLGVEFYTYTSIYRWIDLDPQVTHCVYECNTDIENAIGNGLSVFLNKKSAEIFEELDTPLAYIYPIANPLMRYPLIKGNNRVPAAALGVRPDFIGPCRIEFAGGYEDIDAIFSSCYIKYEITIP